MQRHAVRTMIVTLTSVTALGGCGPSSAGQANANDARGNPDRSTSSLLDRYPANEALRATIDAHAQGGSGQPRDHLLMTSWFAGPDARVSFWSTVDTAGHLTTYRFVHDWAVQDTQQSDLTEIQLAELAGAIARLPAPTVANVPVERLMLVSFRHDGARVTRAYDRSALPDEVAKLFATTGAAPGPAPPTGG